MRASLSAFGFTVTLLGGLVALTAAFETKSSAPPASLTILSEPPGAQVLMDGRPIGKAPITLASVRGTHQLAFRLNGYASAEATVKEAVTRVHQRLRPLSASLSIQEAGKARLKLGPGIPRALEGKGPWKLPPGQYELTAVRDKIPAKPKRFELKAGQSLELALDWPALPPLPRLPSTAPVGSRLPPRLPAPPIYSPPPSYNAPRYNYYQPPARPVYRAPAEPLFTPIPPSHYEPPPPPSYPGGPEPVFTPLP